MKNQENKIEGKVEEKGVEKIGAGEREIEEK
jgi:hypothetical protein